MSVRNSTSKTQQVILSKRIELRPKHLIFLILLISVFSEALIDELGVSNLVIYANDIVLIALLLYMIVDGLRRKLFSNQKGSLVVFFLFFLVTIISTFFNFESFFLTLWGYRTLLRGFIFFFACTIYLSPKDFLSIANFAFYIQIINFLLVLYQYFVLGLYMDTLGGIFGHGNGGLLNPFQAILFAFYLARYVAQRKGLIRLIIITFTSLVIAALAEEKAFFVYLVVDVVIIVLLNKPSLKTVLFLIICFLCLYFAFNVLGQVNNTTFNMMSDFNWLVEYANDSYGISRLDPYSYINSHYFRNDWIKYLFGYGVGNCNYSSFSIFTSSFYLRNHAINYMWFTHAFVLLETGYVGFILFVAFFLYLILFSYCNRKSLSYYASFEIAVAVVAILSMMFSSSLIMNGSFFIYFALASIYIMGKSQGKKFKRGNK